MRRGGTAAALLAATWFAAPPTRAETPLEPGTFLYADPSLVVGVFDASVVVLTHVDPEGTTGLIVNKPTQLEPHELVDVPGVERLRRPLYLGGPVSTEGIFALVRLPASSSDRDEHVIADVFFVRDTDALERSLRGPGPDARVRLYAGYSGWAPGQLEGEIARGSWVVVPGSAEAIFSDAPETLWEEVHRLLGVIEARLAPAQSPGEPLRRK